MKTLSAFAVGDYRKALFKTDLEITAELSSTLADDWSEAGALDSLVSTEREVEFRRVSISTQGAPRQFLRFRVELLP